MDERIAPDGSLMVPEIAGRNVCEGCRFFNVGKGCRRPIKDRGNPATNCSQLSIVFIENTPEARAAYVAAKLEAANG